MGEMGKRAPSEPAKCEHGVPVTKVCWSCSLVARLVPSSEYEGGWRVALCNLEIDDRDLAEELRDTKLVDAVVEGLWVHVIEGTRELVVRAFLAIGLRVEFAETKAVHLASTMPAPACAEAV